MRKKIKYNLGGPVKTGWSPSPDQSLDFMSGIGMIQPGPVVSSAYNVMAPQLQGLSNVPQQTIDSLTPVTGSGPGSGMGALNFGMRQLEQQLAMPDNEFDQAQTTITKAKKAGNLIARGRDAVQHARNVKKAADVAKASQDVSGLLGNLGSMSGQAASTAAKEAGKSAFGSFLASGAGAAASAGAGILGKAIQELDKKDGNFSTAGAMGGGALQGAAIGSALGPIGTVAGAAIGAGVGAMQKSKFEHNAEMEELTKKTEEAKEAAQSRLAGRAILNSFPVEGIKEQVYALGGEHDPPVAKQATVPGSNTYAELYAQLNPEYAAQFANLPPSNDRLTSYTDAELQAFENRVMQERGAAATEQVIQNVADFHRENPLDAVGLELAILGQVPIIGEPADIVNASISGVRSLYNYAVGDTAKAKEQAALAGLSASAAIPFVGNATGATRLAHSAHGLAHSAHNIERGVIAAKGLKAGNYASKKALGGYTNDPDYLAEGGEMIQHAPGDLPKTDNNGSVTPVTKTIARINGDKHTAPSGGVGMEGEESARIYSDQLHVPADLVAQLSKL